MERVNCTAHNAAKASAYLAHAGYLGHHPRGLLWHLPWWQRQRRQQKQEPERQEGVRRERRAGQWAQLQAAALPHSSK